MPRHRPLYCSLERRAQPVHAAVAVLALSMALSCALCSAGQHHIYVEEATSSGGGLRSDDAGCSSALFLRTHWAEPAAQSDFEVPQQLYGTAQAQAAIRRHQHPRNCSSTRFLLHDMTGDSSDLVSVLATMGQGLALAMQLDRVYILTGAHSKWENSSFCGGGRYDECYFQPFSGCTMQDALAGGRLDAVPPFAEQHDQYWVHAIRLNHTHFGARFGASGVPYQFQDLLLHGPVKARYVSYWWRAQSVTYLVRPANGTVAELQRRRDERFGAAPVPAGTVCLQIVHGDTLSGAALMEDQLFLQRAAELVALNRDLDRSLLLLTHDARSIEFFRQQPDWQVYTTVDADAGSGAGSTAVAEGDEVLDLMFDLVMAMECHAWVGSLTPEYGRGRLFDYLRSTVGCRADKVFVGAVHGSHDDPLSGAA